MIGNLFSACIVLVFAVRSVCGQQMADLEYRPILAAPAYESGPAPLVAIDEAHHNFHTAEGRYRPFAVERVGPKCLYFYDAIFLRFEGPGQPVLAPYRPSRYTGNMATIAEVEKLAFDLPESERAVLASHLLRSLPPVLEDGDEGIAEALRRDAELDSNPDAGIRLDQLDDAVRSRRH